ncbi:MAG: GGDEF domain-containing protein [Gammaproteobacteria bacterium]|nr:GGDEF domain-containing protein [Gammaproteobacteria bacterium]
MAISTYLANVWSVTEFGDPELSGYAETRLCSDTRTGLQIMAAMGLAMFVAIAILSWILPLDRVYLTTSLLLALLAVHVFISAHFLKDISSLHALGMAFLTIGALALTVLAHRAGELHMGMMAGMVILFMAVPLVPWALRETSIIVGLTYLLLTSSLIAVPGRFSSDSLLILQLLLFGAAVVVLVITGRNTFIRKHDVQAQFKLENAHGEMQLLTMQDHLTGAWNRRYLDLRFKDFARYCNETNKTLYVAVLDIDDFKGINDRFGHDVGDKILIQVADTFVRHLGKNGRLIRLGGDEFEIIYSGNSLDVLIESAMRELQQSDIAGELRGLRSVTLSAGIARHEPGKPADAESLYRRADRALYSSKHNREHAANDAAMVSRTGTWKL